MVCFSRMFAVKTQSSKEVFYSTAWLHQHTPLCSNRTPTDDVLPVDDVGSSVASVLKSPLIIAPRLSSVEINDNISAGRDDEVSPIGVIPSRE